MPPLDIFSFSFGPFLFPDAEVPPLLDRFGLLIRHRLSRTAALALLLTLSCGGCLRRRLTIRSDPPGAVVYVDRRPEPIGVTPVSTSFTYYGTRQIQLVKDGYETLTIRQNFAPPWYEIPPIDFFVENFWPREVRDERIVSFHLEPRKRIPAEEILQRAGQLKENTYQGIATPLRPAGAPRVPPGSALPAETLPPAAAPSR